MSQNIIPNSNPSIESRSVQPSNLPNPQGGISNVIMYAYMLLVDSANQKNQAALTKTKVMQGFNYSLQRLNSLEEKLKFYSIPVANIVHKTITYWKWTGRFWKHGAFRYQKKIHETYTANRDQIDNVQQQNEQVQKQRSDLQNQMTLIQQNSQVGNSMIQSLLDDASSTISETQSLPQLLQSMTNQLLLHHP